MDTTGKISKTVKFDSYVKVTQGKFYRVDGSTTQWKGVIPDIELPDMYAMDKFRERATVSALRPDNSKPSIYQALPPIPFVELGIKSNARVTSNRDFKAITKFIDWYKSMDGTRIIPLQWAGYIKYYKEVTNMYHSIESEDDSLNVAFRATNNSLDMQRGKLITEQSKAINEVSIKRIEKDNYIAESFRIMQDWLEQ